MFKLSKFITTLILLFTPVYVARAQNLRDAIIGNVTTVGQVLGDPTITFPELVASILRFLLTALGAIFLILIVYGGFMWMTAGGNSQQVEKAGGVLKNSAIGLIIIIVSYAITITVFDIILNATNPI